GGVKLGALVDHNQVELAVAVEVGDRHLRRAHEMPGERDGGLEGTVAVPQKDRDPAEVHQDVVAGVRHHEVGFAVAVEIGQSQAEGLSVRAHGIVNGRLEGAVAVAQQNVDAAKIGTADVPGHDIELPVAVDVAYRQGNGHFPGGRQLRFLED